MNPPRGDHGASRTPVAAVGRGTVLVALAVLIGIVLLQAVDDGGGEFSSDPTPAKTSSTKRASSSTTTTSKASKPKLQVVVLNGSGKPGAAKTLSDQLGNSRYPMLTPGNAPKQATTIVYFREGFEKEAGQISSLVSTTTRVQALPNPSSFGADADAATVIVVIGAN